MMRNLKKRILGFGLAVMMATSMSMPVYASSYDYAPADFSNNPYLDTSYMAKEDWYGSYSCVTPTANYRLTISPSWDMPDEWVITATCAVMDPQYGREVVVSSWVGNTWANLDAGLTNQEESTGAVAAFINWNGNPENPDIGVGIAYHPETEDIFLLVTPTNTEEMTKDWGFGITKGDAFASAYQGLWYKRVSSAYPLYFFGENPDWYNTWIDAGQETPYVTWDEYTSGQKIPAPLPNPFDPYRTMGY